MSGETSTGVQTSIDSWVPSSRFRPDRFTTNFNEAFVSSATHLVACLLHTPSSTVDLTPLRELVDSLEITSSEVYVQITPSLKAAFDQLDVWSSDDVISANAIYLCLYYADGPSTEAPQATIHSASVLVYERMYDFVYNTDYDEELTTLMEKLGAVEFDGFDAALPYLQSLENLWVQYSSNSWFASGRGSEFYVDLQPAQIAYVRADSSWNMACQILLTPFVVYDLGTNFLFTGLTALTRIAYPVAKYLTGIGSKFLFSNVGNILATDAGKKLTDLAKNKLTSEILKNPVQSAFISNLRNSMLSKAIGKLLPIVEKHSATLPGCLTAFYLNKKNSPTGEYNPIVGRSSATDTTKETWRKPVDDLAMWLLDRGIDIYSRRTSENTLNEVNGVLELIHDVDAEFSTGKTEFEGRGPGKSPVQNINDYDNMYFGDYMKQNRQMLVQASQNITDLTAPETRAATLAAIEIGGDPGAYVPVDEEGDLPDLQDMLEAENRFESARTQNVQLQGALSDQRARTSKAEQERDNLQRIIDRGVDTSASMSQSSRYVNWDASQSKELLACINSRWMNLKDAFELIDTLNACNFKYDTSRDSAREALTGDQFLIPFPVKFNVRFPNDLALVCQNHTDVQRAITDILAALNYKNDENVRGPNSNDKPKVRETTSYNDAALNYVNAVSTLSSIFKRVALSQSKFERRFGLVWLSP